MIHGSIGGPAAWVGQEGAFAGAAAIALPGHPMGVAFTDREDAVAYLVGLIAQVPAPRVLVGHELGAALALEVALDHPDLVAGVVVSGLGIDPPRVADADADALIAACLREDDSDAAATLRREMDATTDDSRGRTAMLAADLTYHRRLGALEVPVLVIAGDDDPRVPLSQTHALADALPVRCGVTIEGARHLPMADAADAFNLYVAAFLARVDVGLATA